MLTATTLSIWCGVLIGPFFIIVFLVEGMLRSGYQSLRQPVSALAIGERGWIQRANFFITGFLALAYVPGLHVALAAYGNSWWPPTLVAVFGLGLIAAGTFVTDITGLAWPSRAERTRSGILHDQASGPVFAALIAASVIFANLFAGTGDSGWALYSAISAIAIVVFFALAGLGFAFKLHLNSVGGLMQRLSIIAGWMWLSLVAAHLLGVL
ncbi:MAG TPA: DUF998 domain-containing protein [Candidatus Paceibacterota bacterium]|nr:DUF998 domain-containing protein [Candidatus Paceibacterota bacterium]